MSKKSIPYFNNPGIVMLFLCAVLFTNNFFSQGVAIFSGNVKDTHLLVDSLARQLNKYYVLKDEAVKMSDFIKKKCAAGGYDNIKDPHALAGALTADVLSVHHDEHFHVEYNPQMANELLGNIDDVPKMVSERLKQEKLKNFGFKDIRILNGKLPMLRLNFYPMPVRLLSTCAMALAAHPKW
jgi:hypothetical protein